MATTEVRSEDGESPKPALSYAPSAGMLLVKLGHAAERWFTEALKPTNLTPKHLGVLFEVRAQPRSQQALSASIGLDPSKLVGLLNDLEDEGLLVRRRDPADRRRHIVEVSKDGQARLTEAEQAAKVVQERLFGGLEEAERRQLHELLARVADDSGILEGCASLVIRPE